jgi:hypothetical protein
MILLYFSSWSSPCFVAQAGFKLMIFFPVPFECWDYRHIPPCLTSKHFKIGDFPELCRWAQFKKKSLPKREAGGWEWKERDVVLKAEHQSLRFKDAVLVVLKRKMRPQSKGCWQPPESARHSVTNPPLEPLVGAQPCQHLLTSRTVR